MKFQAADDIRPWASLPDSNSPDVGLPAHERPPPLSHSRRPSLLPMRLTFAIISGFWVLWYLAQTSLAFMNSPERAASWMAPRLLVALAGAALSCAIAAALNSLSSKSLLQRALAALALSIAGTVVHSIVTQRIWNVLSPDSMPPSPLWIVYGTDVLVRFWFFALQSAIILALSYAAEIRERERQINSLQALAQGAQLRALRNQLNPHFLFNALNSVVGLISAGRPKDAETMTENLADFLRLTLALDPQQLITLDKEIELQKLYLAIEKVRFPERLAVRVDVSDDARMALVPSLITQPLIENTIKYAVARSTEPVELRIIAVALRDELEIVVEDSGGNAQDINPKGARLGLRNVLERLNMHYDGAGELVAEQQPGAGFRNRITIPLHFAPAEADQPELVSLERPSPPTGAY